MFNEFLYIFAKPNKQTNKYIKILQFKNLFTMTEIKPNIRATLRSLSPGDSLHLPATACRDSYLRNCATVLKELGYVLHVTKNATGFLVWREA